MQVEFIHFENLDLLQEFTRMYFDGSLSLANYSRRLQDVTGWEVVEATRTCAKLANRASGMGIAIKA